MPLPSVECLSDDDPSSPPVPPPPLPPLDSNVGGTTDGSSGVVVEPPAKKRRLPGDRSIVSMATMTALRQQLRRQVNSTCRCFRKSCKHPSDRRNCFEPFRTQDLFNEAMALRKELVSMQKDDADRKVF